MPRGFLGNLWRKEMRGGAVFGLEFCTFLCDHACARSLSWRFNFPVLASSDSLVNNSLRGKP